MTKKRYYNKEKNKTYFEGNRMTFKLDGVVYSSVPTEEQLTALGYVYTPEAQPKELTEEEKAQQARLQRMEKIKEALDKTDYLDHKANDGEDMSEANEKYGGDWRAYRRALRAEYNKLEEMNVENK